MNTFTGLYFSKLAPKFITVSLLSIEYPFVHLSYHKFSYKGRFLNILWVKCNESSYSFKCTAKGLHLENWGSTHTVQLFFPSVFRDADETQAKPALSHTHARSFLGAAEDDMQSACESRLIDDMQSACESRLMALMLFNYPLQLSHLLMESKKDITSEFKASKLNIPISTSLLHHLSHYWTSNDILTSAFKSKLLLFTVAYSSF